jgi:hypothetical protein
MHSATELEFDHVRKQHQQSNPKYFDNHSSFPVPVPAQYTKLQDVDRVPKYFMIVPEIESSLDK